MEELLSNDESQWVNVQGPVKQMITGITKSIQVQATGLRDLDKQMGKCITREKAEKLITDTFSECFLQQDAAILMQNVNKKADQEDVSGIEANLIQVSHQLGRLNEVLQTQNSAIRDLNSRVTMLTEEMEDLRNPNYDQMFSYVDRQINTVRTDINEKLSAKAELKDMEKAAYKSIDAVYKNLTGQMSALQKDIGKAATKEDFHHLLSNKADGSDVRDMAADLKKCVSKQEMQHNIASQVRPLVTAVTSLEKVIQIQEDRSNKPPVPVYEPLSAKHTWTHDKITSLIEDVITQRYPSMSDAVSTTCLDSSMTELREYLLRELGAHVESLRLEIGSTSREAAGGLRKHVEGRIQELSEGMRDARDTSTKAKNGLKELANNVAKSLAKKAERSDLKKLIKEMESKDQPKTHIQHASFTESHRSHNNSAMMHHNMQGQGQQNQNLSQSQMNRSMHAMDLLDPENSSAANAKRIRSLTADVDILKSDLMKISSLHMDNSRDISDIRNDLENEVKQLRLKYAAEKKGYATAQSQHHYENPDSYSASSRGNGGGSVNYTDWKIALGELGLNLRREMSDKPGREEMINMIAAELEPIDHKLQTNVTAVSTKASVEDISALDNALTDLRTKVAGELTGGRWLWTNGKIGRDGWVPWDTEVQNAAPAVLSWMKGSTSITARMPGLYRICGAVFTSLPSALQICLNGEPILSLQPNVSDPDTANNSQILREERYVIRRLRHSIGEVTCLAIDEYVSLPADSVLAMRFHSAATAQAFFSIKKL